MDKMTIGAQNAVKCLGITDKDTVFIITDKAKEHIGKYISDEVEKTGASVSVHVLESYGARPFLNIPEALRNDLLEAKPTVSFFIAEGQPGEVKMRIPLLTLISSELNLRHGHMINITDQIMEEGMNADFDNVYDITMKVYDIVKSAKTIHVTSPNGTDVTGTFSPELLWIPCHARYHTSGWGNLPDGEVFTAPAAVDGTIVCDLLGDYFDQKYGVLKNQVTLQVKDGYITSVSCEDKVLEKELSDYLHSNPNGIRAGEFAIGTLVGLKDLIGNMLQDEKMPGLHIAFGNPYPEHTHANWDASTHVDVIPKNCTIDVDGQRIMTNGVFTI